MILQLIRPDESPTAYSIHGPPYQVPHTSASLASNYEYRYNPNHLDMAAPWTGCATGTAPMIELDFVRQWDGDVGFSLFLQPNGGAYAHIIAPGIRKRPS